MGVCEAGCQVAIFGILVAVAVVACLLILNHVWDRRSRE